MLLLAIANYSAKAQTFFAITHVNIVDVKNETIIPDETVLIKDSLIEKIGTNLKLPAHATIIEAKNKYLIPGLWDMHYHNMDGKSVAITDSALIPLLIANGITGTRDMAAVNETLQRRDAIRSGKMIAPETYIGPMVDGPKPSNPVAIAVKDTLRAVTVIDSLKNRGYDFIKVYTRLPRDIYFKIAEHCRQIHIPFEGHVPDVITPVEASAAGQKSVEHEIMMASYCSSLPDSMHEQNTWTEWDIYYWAGDSMISEALPLMNSFDTTKLYKAADVFKQNNTWYCPTLITLKNILEHNNPAKPHSDELLQYVADSLKSYLQWQQFTDSQKIYTAKDWNLKEKYFRLQQMMVKKLYERNVNLLAGDDNNNPFCIAGFSLQQELKELVDCGLKDADVLKIATYNPTIFFDIENKEGTVEEGKIASVVLLNDNPLNNISNMQKINAVFIKGKYFNRQRLDAMLNSVKEFCKSH